jgi:hypothetical protein
MIVRFAGRVTDGDGRANRGHAAFRRNLMTVRHQETDAMTAPAPAGAEQCPNLKFFAVIDYAIVAFSAFNSVI